MKNSKIHRHARHETLETENDLHVFLDGMEQPTRIFLLREALGNVLKEPRYRNGICVAQGLKHNSLEEPNLQSRVQTKMAVSE